MSRPEAPVPDSPFEEPWQASAFALAVELSRRGAFTWAEWSASLAQTIAAAPDAPYYEAWLGVLERLVAAKGLTGESELAARKDAWARAYRFTSHGQPVDLANAG